MRCLVHLGTIALFTSSDCILSSLCIRSVYHTFQFRWRPVPSGRVQLLHGFVLDDSILGLCNRAIQAVEKRKVRSCVFKISESRSCRSISYHRNSLPHHKQYLQSDHVAGCLRLGTMSLIPWTKKNSLIPNSVILAIN